MGQKERGQRELWKRENKKPEMQEIKICRDIVTFFSPGPASSPNDVLVEGAPKNLSFRRASGTGLTINLRPAE